MKLKTNILFSLLLCGTFATAQNLKLDILPPSVTLGQDSATVSMKIGKILLRNCAQRAKVNTLQSFSSRKDYIPATAVQG